jgi:hypothetical protein
MCGVGDRRTMSVFVDGCNRCQMKPLQPCHPQCHSVKCFTDTTISDQPLTRALFLTDF